MTEINPKTPRNGVLLANLGTPEAPERGPVGRFLREFLSDPRVVDLPRLLWLPLLNGVIIPVRAGRSAKAYREIWWDEGSPLLVHGRALAAKVADGTPCCDWVGENGAGHYVKMTHNGIEYGDMQLICEAYFLMKYAIGMSNQEMHEVFAEWNEGTLESYLIEITRDILGFQDEGRTDRARQKLAGRNGAERSVGRRARPATARLRSARALPSRRGP